MIQNKNLTLARALMEPVVTPGGPVQKDRPFLSRRTASPAGAMLKSGACDYEPSAAKPSALVLKSSGNVSRRILTGVPGTGAPSSHPPVIRHAAEKCVGDEILQCKRVKPPMMKVTFHTELKVRRGL
jgi:hypothetical protein